MSRSILAFLGFAVCSAGCVPVTEPIGDIDTDALLHHTLALLEHGIGGPARVHASTEPNANRQPI